MPLQTHVQVLKWRETRNMMAALEGMQDTSEFSEAYCASLADSSAPGCQLVEVFNSHGVFLPQLAGQGGLNKGGPISSSIPYTAQAGVQSTELKLQHLAVREEERPA